MIGMGDEGGAWSRGLFWASIFINFGVYYEMKGFVIWKEIPRVFVVGNLISFTTEILLFNVILMKASRQKKMVLEFQRNIIQNLN